jgi:hypothetical protein
MNYWGDDRDILEAAYPSCTSFVTFHNEYKTGLLESIDCGIVFLFSKYSATSITRFKFLCYALEDSAPWDQFEVIVIDVDGLKCGNPFAIYEQFSGNGDAFWIQSGQIINSLGNAWSNETFDVHTKHLWGYLHRSVN